MVAPTEGQGDEGASMDMQGVHSNFPCSFFTILDNNITVGELARGKEQGTRAHPCPGGLLGGAGGREITWQQISLRCSAVIQALQEVYRD
jgi:hypothetical protein